MNWLVFAISTAFTESLKDVFSKKSLRSINEYTTAWALPTFSLCFLLPLLFFIEIPDLSMEFWIALFVSGGLNVLAVILYMKALKSSDLSLTVPMVAFTPLFLLITSPLILGEFPNITGLIGVLLIVTGSYILHLRPNQKSYLAPFRALFEEKGPRLMLMVALIWSVTSNFDKIGIQNSSPLFWSIAATLFMSVGLTPIVWVKFEKQDINSATLLLRLLPIGFFNALTIVFQMIAIDMTLVAYVISIKRTSAILVVLWGYFIFKESGIKNRLPGVIIMITGVFLISLL